MAGVVTGVPSRLEFVIVLKCNLRFKNISLEMVYNRLMEEFYRLEHHGHTSIAKMIEKCSQKAAEMYQEQLEADESDEYGSDESDESEPDDNETDEESLECSE